MKSNEKTNVKGKGFFKKVDPISFALVVLLGASASFAAFQLVWNADAPVVSPGVVDNDDSTIPVVSNVAWLEEEVISPLETEEVAVMTSFFDAEADSAAAIADSLFVFPVGSGAYMSQNSFGTSFAAANGDVANVVSMLSGVVTSVEHDELVRGTIVTIQHENGAISVYNGLYDVTVTGGEEIEQGTVLGTTGLSLMEPESGNVVHVQFLLDGVEINPESVLNQRLGDL